MFIRIILAIFLTFFSTIVLANGYCDTRPTASERQRCYNNQQSSGGGHDTVTLANMAVGRMKANSAAIMKAEHIPEEDRKAFAKDQERFMKDLQNACRQQASCVLANVKSRNDALVKFYNGYKKK